MLFIFEILLLSTTVFIIINQIILKRSLKPVFYFHLCSPKPLHRFYFTFSWYARMSLVYVQMNEVTAEKPVFFSVFWGVFWWISLGSLVTFGSAWWFLSDTLSKHSCAALSQVLSHSPGLLLATKLSSSLPQPLLLPLSFQEFL